MLEWAKAVSRVFICHRWHIAPSLLAILLLAPPAFLVGQQPSAASGEIHGRVVDEALMPLQGASVVLERIVPAEQTSSTGGIAVGTRTVVTGVDGEYRFAGLPRAQYELTVTRLG